MSSAPTPVVVSRLLSVREVASALGISMPTAWRRIADGTIRTTRIGPRVVRIREDELARLMGTSSPTTELR